MVVPEKALSLSSLIKSIKGIGATRADAFSKIDIVNVLDLISYYPRKHLERSTVLPISKLNVNHDATIIGKVETAGMRRSKRRQYFQAVLSDGKGMLTLRWFNAARYIKKSITIGDRLAVSGKVDFFCFSEPKSSSQPLYAPEVLVINADHLNPRSPLF